MAFQNVYRFANSVLMMKKSKKKMKVFGTGWRTYGKPQTRKFCMPPDRRAGSELELELAGVNKMKRPLRKSPALLKFEFDRK